MRGIWDFAPKSKICNICGQKKEKRVLSPFLSYTPKDDDWLAEIKIPIVEDGIYKTKSADICGCCYKNLSNAIMCVFKGKEKTEVKDNQISFAFG